jgi:outer membrane protein TolC
VALELPLFDAGSAAHAKAARRLRAGMHEQVQLAVEIRSTARTLRERASLLAARARFLRAEHLPQREAVVRTTVQTYNAMQIGAFDVLAQRRVQLADQREYVTTLRDAHLARLDLQQLLAGSLPRERASGHATTSAGFTDADADTSSREGHR